MRTRLQSRSVKVMNLERKKYDRLRWGQLSENSEFGRKEWI
jgi:hypothetical protein